MALTAAVHHAYDIVFACWCVQVDVDEVRKLRRVDAAAISKQPKLTEMDVMAVVQNDSTFLEVRGRLAGAGGWDEAQCAHIVKMHGYRGYPSSHATHNKFVMCCCWQHRQPQFALMLPTACCQAADMHASTVSGSGVR